MGQLPDGDDDFLDLPVDRQLRGLRPSRLPGWMPRKQLLRDRFLLAFSAAMRPAGPAPSTAMSPHNSVPSLL